MTEDFLHFIWRTRNFNFQNLLTTEGLEVEIHEFGQLNTNAGPDFSMARLTIDGTLWAGNVEMHLSASDWNRHGHTTDPAYESVILHVVMEDDLPVYTGTRKLPCIELKDRIQPRLLGQYLRLMATSSWVPCAMHLESVPLISKLTWLERMLIERIQTKTSVIHGLLDETHENWEEVFYHSLASAYGFKVNAAPFARLARLIPLKHMKKHADASFRLEALLFGGAGMLNRIFSDPYPLALQKEFNHLSAMYGLQVMDARAWNWGRLRPPNFPTVRISQFASLMKNFHGLFRNMLESPDVASLQFYFNAEVSDYWQSHSDFDKPMRLNSKRMGLQSVNSILINTVVPFLFCYGKRRGEDRFIELAIEMMAALPAEENQVTKHWEQIHMPNENAGHSQGLLHLKHTYCDQKRCVSCTIGSQILISTQKS